MNWQTLLTIAPTALSASFYTTTHITFLCAMKSRRKSSLPAPAERPFVSILKPVAGVDDGLLENLSSFVDLDYPAYELLIGIASPEDPAVSVVQAFIAAHPGLAAKLVWTSPTGGEVVNPKVAQLIDLTRAARGAVLVVSDANVRVPRTYLRSLVDALSQPGVGIVSSVIGGAGARTLAAAIDTAQLGAYVAPSIVTAHKMGVWPITVGKSMAMRKADLARVGGFESVANVLAEDDVLGRRFEAMGHRVELCLDPIENYNADASWPRMLERHIRWAKMRRSLTPFGFLFELLLSPLVMATAVALIAPSHLSLLIWACSLALCWVGAFLSLTQIGTRHAFTIAALEPLRVALMFFCSCVGCLNRRVVWRGNAFTIAAGSRLIPEGDASAAQDPRAQNPAA